MIQNDIMLMMLCIICGNRLYVRAVNPVAARDLALAGGWGFMHLKPPACVCPFHNPARIESVAPVEIV